jgi:hypothetical protein
MALPRSGYLSIDENIIGDGPRSGYLSISGNIRAREGASVLNLSGLR